MIEFIKGFFKESSSESMTRLTLFITCINVNAMCACCLLVFVQTDGKLDYSSQSALLSGLLLAAFVTNKVLQKGKENPTTNKE